MATHASADANDPNSFAERSHATASPDHSNMAQHRLVLMELKNVLRANRTENLCNLAMRSTRDSGAEENLLLLYQRSQNTFLCVELLEN